MDELDREMDVYCDCLDDVVVGGDLEVCRRRRCGSRFVMIMVVFDEEMEIIRGDRCDWLVLFVWRLNGGDGRNGYVDFLDNGNYIIIRVCGCGRMCVFSVWDDDWDLFDNWRSGLLVDWFWILLGFLGFIFN